VLGGGVEEDADLEAGVGQVDEAAAEDVCGALGGWRESDNDAHRGGFPGTVGAQEPGDAAGLGGEGDVVDGGVVAVAFGYGFDGNHWFSKWLAVVSRGLWVRRGRGRPEVVGVRFSRPW
jgi:hypothetical protein